MIPLLFPLIAVRQLQPKSCIVRGICHALCQQNGDALSTLPESFACPRGVLRAERRSSGSTRAKDTAEVTDRLCLRNRQPHDWPRLAVGSRWGLGLHHLTRRLCASRLWPGAENTVEGDLQARGTL